MQLSGRTEHYGNRVRKAFATMRHAHDLDDVLASFLDEWGGSTLPVVPRTPLTLEGEFDMAPAPGAPDITRVMYSDATSYFPDDISSKVDRFPFSVSLETPRAYLDHVGGTCRSNPGVDADPQQVGQDDSSQIALPPCPASVFNRPKAGFAVPVGKWIRGRCSTRTRRCGKFPK